MLAFRQAVIKDDPIWEQIVAGSISEQSIRGRSEMMLAVDDSLGRIISTLKQVNKIENTLIIFTSDNGYFFCEHGLATERRLPYEESAKSPLLIQYPKMVKGAQKSDALIISIDYAATALDAAGIDLPDHVQGRSLMPLLTGQTEEIRDAAYIEYYSHENPFYWTAKTDYRIVRKGNYKYIRWIRFEDRAELYNLNADPFERSNLIDDPNMTALLQDLNVVLNEHVLTAMGLADE